MPLSPSEGTAAGPGWLVLADTGGTFTDVLARSPSGQWRRIKVLSSGTWRCRIAAQPSGTFLLENAPAWPVDLAGFSHGASSLRSAGSGLWRLEPASEPLPDTLELRTGEEAPVLGWRLLSGTPAGAALPACEFRLATTRATNALLEGKTARVALFVTEGFADLLEIGNQQRPDLFSLAEPADPAPGPVVEVPGRMDHLGNELRAVPGSGGWLDRARALLADGVHDAAVCLLHAHRNPTHERAVAETLRAMGYQRISCSAELSPLPRYLQRAETTRIHASLVPVMDAYLDGVARPLAQSSLLVMTSAGALTERAEFRARDSLMSGPAGGLNAVASLGASCGLRRLVAFDMGGTSTDVARIDGRPSRRAEVRVGSRRLQAPALHVESVAAGGGSVCAVGHDGLRVGPESAGSSPGPACYGRGGPLTLTDLHLLLGRIRPELFAFPPDLAAARRALDALAVRAGEMGIHTSDTDSLAARLLELADETMAGALRAVTLREGHDPAGHALVSYGGAGGLHACALAARLGIDTVLAPLNAGLFSAEGLGCTAVERLEDRALIPVPLGDSAEEVERVLRQTEQSLAARSGRLEGSFSLAREVQVRRRGHDFTLHLPWTGEPGPIAGAFQERYRGLFGLDVAAAELEICAVRATLAQRMPAPAPESFERHVDASARPAYRASVWTGVRFEEVPVHPRACLKPGVRLEGPAVVQDETATFWLPGGWTCTIGSHGTLRACIRTAHPPRPAAPEIVTARLSQLAIDMGVRLASTAVSVNVRERLDFSCALLDREGHLAVHAPHVPVHLGSLGVCVRAVAAGRRASPGDILLTNHPALGGSHLPDLTVLAPVHAPSGELIAWVANRAHHAEIGGTTPGSLPVNARRLEEEGVILEPICISRNGTTDLSELDRVLRNSPYPSRRPQENLADVRAQVASVRLGIERLSALAGEIGADRFIASLQTLRRAGSAALSAELARRGPFDLCDVDRLDDGTPLEVRLRSDGTRLTVDFSGSGAQHPGNFNATPAIVRSAVLYALRVWIGGELPLNEGVLDAVDIRIPGGSVLSPTFAGPPGQAPAVMGGNVETSQRVVDILLGALGLCARSQGTMNNLVFGDRSRSFYETICGGGGATPALAGRNCRHVHMTNTAITDAEILEERYPVRLHRFERRRGSGGRGMRAGGDGVVREIEFLEPLTLSLLTQRRNNGPAGANGGGAGSCGSQTLRRADGTSIQLPASATEPVSPGDRLRIETPGGGAWGPPAD